MFKHSIILTMGLLLLSGFANASTEIDHVQFLPKHIVLIILRYVELQEYLEFITVTSTMRQQHISIVPEQIYLRYHELLTTKSLTPADLLALRHYDHFLRMTLECHLPAREVLDHPLVFFTEYHAPHIMGTTHKTQIMNFFQQRWDKCFATNEVCFVGMYSYSPVDRKRCALPLVYDVLTEQLGLCAFENDNIWWNHIRLPAVLVFTGGKHGERIHTERMGEWHGKALELWFKEGKVQVYWYSVAIGRVHMSFHAGKLYRIQANVEPSELLHTFWSCGNDQYIAEGCHLVDMTFTIIHAFYYPSPVEQSDNQRR